MDVSQNKDNVKIENNKFKVDDIYMHIPTGYVFIINMVLRDLLLCYVAHRGIIVASYGVRIDEAFKCSDWHYYGNQKLEMNRAKENIPYWTKINGR